MKSCSGLLALAAAVGYCASATALTNVYSTHFERSEGYDPTFELVGQNQWKTDTQSYGGNGLVTNFLGTQAAYVGLFPLYNPPGNLISVFPQVNFSPLKNGTPLANFSVLLSVVDSTTTNRDDFRWSVYNTRGDRLFSLSLYNVDLYAYVLLDGTNDFQSTGVFFTNDKPYTLNVAMDFSKNSWSATLSGVLLATNQPITTTNALLDLGDIDAVWAVNAPAAPGDNFMIFDNYQITASALPPPPSLASLGLGANGAFLMRVFGNSGSAYAVEASTNLLQWTSLKTNIVTGSSFDYIDSAAPLYSRRYYRARSVP